MAHLTDEEIADLKARLSTSVLTGALIGHANEFLMRLIEEVEEHRKVKTAPKKKYTLKVGEMDVKKAAVVEDLDSGEASKGEGDFTDGPPTEDPPADPKPEAPTGGEGAAPEAKDSKPVEKDEKDEKKSKAKDEKKSDEKKSEKKA